MKIIGLTGFAKSGKSTAADILKKQGGKELAFAKHLKDVCSGVFAVERSYFDDQSFKEIPFNYSLHVSENHIAEILNYFDVPKEHLPATIKAHAGMVLQTPRHIAQYVGTEILRAIDTDIHIKMAFKLNEGTEGLLICSDVRFQNELAAVQNQGGIVLGISRKAATPADLINLHPSEKEIPNLIRQSDVIINNEGTLTDFENLVLASIKV